MEQLWNQRLKIEQDYLEAYKNLLECLKNELPETKDSNYWKKVIEIQKTENEIAAKETYINSLLTDKAQQELSMEFKRKLAKEKGILILQKARSPLIKGDTALQLEGLLKEKHDSGSDSWVNWIWRINEVLNKTLA